MHIDLTYVVSKNVTSAILEINIIGSNEGKYNYRITDAKDKLMMCGQFEGKLTRSCLYVGSLLPGEYFFQIEENSKETFFVLGVL
jgi:hypothetical protein